MIALSITFSRAIISPPVRTVAKHSKLVFGVGVGAGVAI
jgi:hypothetical protein